MIDTATALKQQCYILFDTTEQLKQFVIDNKIHPFMGVNDEKTYYIAPNQNMENTCQQTNSFMMTYKFLNTVN
jgi:hypothetical protein